jgi:hypothetical protein
MREADTGNENEKQTQKIVINLVYKVELNTKK